ncbi:MAG: HAMP domain-containing histidine kinase [Chloroflexi bacterium]|nr:HAMP domain-containing histidine kinase [Chloroflexota bacterium]
MSSTEMAQVDISSDILESRKDYFDILLILSVALVMPMGLIILLSNNTGERIVPYIVSGILAFILAREGHQRLAAWIFLLGTYSLIIAWTWFGGASDTRAYTLVLFPLIMSGLILNESDANMAATLLVGGSLAIGFYHEGTSVVEPAAVPTFIALCIVVARQADSTAFRQLTHWALEAHSKSERRSNMYYDQREQLQAALHDLQLANYELGKLNTELEQARQQAEQANTVKSMFLAAMSHELRTPLNSIINFSQFMLDGMMGPVNEEQVESLGYVYSSGIHLLHLINDVLDISKIEAGALELFVEDNVNLHDELTMVMKTGESLLVDKPVQLCLETDPNLPLLLGDRQRISQIMMNLVSNACKFTDNGTITLSAQHRNGSVVLAVKDSGPGIAPEDHEAVFESFRQTRRGFKAGGTGLGLPISRKLAEAHGGRLWLESEPGAGATFFVELPIRPEALIPLIHEKAS